MSFVEATLAILLEGVDELPERLVAAITFAEDDDEDNDVLWDDFMVASIYNKVQRWRM